MKNYTALLSIGTGLTDFQVAKHNELATALLSLWGLWNRKACQDKLNNLMERKVGSRFDFGNIRLEVR